MGFVDTLFKTRKKDTIVMLRKYDDVYKMEKRLKVTPGQEFSYQGKRYMFPPKANYLERNGCFCFFMDAEHCNSLPFRGQVDSAFTASQIDNYVSDHLIKGFSRSFGDLWKQDRMMVLSLIGSGVGIGCVLTAALFIFGVG